MGIDRSHSSKTKASSKPTLETSSDKNDLASHADHIVRLQELIGNQAVQRLLKKSTVSSNPSVIQRVMSFQDTLTYWKQLDSGAVKPPKPAFSFPKKPTAANTPQDSGAANTAPASQQDAVPGDDNHDGGYDFGDNVTPNATKDSDSNDGGYDFGDNATPNATKASDDNDGGYDFGGGSANTREEDGGIETTKDENESVVNNPPEPKRRLRWGYGTYYNNPDQTRWMNPDDTKSLETGDSTFKPKEMEAFEKKFELEKGPSKKHPGFQKAKWGNRKPVKYIRNETERASYELKLQEGTNLFFWRGEPVDTMKMKRIAGFGEARGSTRMIFVMTPSGKIYVADEGAETAIGQNNSDLQYRFNHSTLVQGEAVASAGEIWFENGRLKGISDKSGHYRPEFEYTLQILQQFQNNGISLMGVTLELWNSEKKAVDVYSAEEVVSGKVKLNQKGTQVVKV